MSTKVEQYAAQVLSREQLSDHLVRLVLGGGGLSSFVSTGVPDEWVGLVVPGQFQSRYYTVRSWDAGQLVCDVVVHEEGLVTEWVQHDCVGETVTVAAARGSFAMPEQSTWLYLVGDLTALPALTRIVETVGDSVPTTVWAEVPEQPPNYLSADLGADINWLAAPADEGSALAKVVESLEWPAGEGYFWMAGESGQMRAIRKHLMHEVRLPSSSYDVMGYWRGGARRQPRAVDPGPIWRAGKAAGKTDAEIWADYDAATEQR